MSQVERKQHGNNSFRKREICNKRVEQFGRKQIDAFMSTSSRNLRRKQNRRGYQGQTIKTRHLYLFIHFVLLIYYSYPQRTQRHVQPNIFYTHIFTQCTKQDCMHRSNTMMAMLKCPKRRDKCNQTHYSTLNTHQELSYSSKFNISRFALHGAQQIVQLLVYLSIINAST